MPDVEPPFAYDLRVAYPGGETYELRDPYSFLPTVGEVDLHLAGEGRHEELYRKLGAHPTEIDGVAGTSFAVWAPNARAVSVVGDFNSWDGRLHPMRTLGSSGIWELFLPGVEPGARYKFELRAQTGELRLKADPYAFEAEVPPQTASIVSRSAFAWDDADWIEARRAAEPLHGPLSIYEVHAPSWRSGLGWRELARPAHAVREGPRVHPRRAPAGRAPPVLGLVGLPGDGVLRAALDPREPRRLPLLRRQAAPERDRPDPRLGPGALPARRLGARALRRHRALRARRPAPRLAPGLGDARLQPRPDRGAELPARERALLDGRVPRRRDPRRRRRVDALPRLLAQGRGVGPQPVRRPRGPRRRRVPQGVQRGRPPARAGGDLGGGGVDRLAGSVAADLPRRARVRVQVEHGLDARHALVLPARARLPPAPPPRAHLLARLRLERELHPPALARRGRPRQALAALEDAGRPLAAAGEPPRALRLHVGAPRQEAPVHGRRAGDAVGVDRGGRGAVVAARARRARGRAGARARPEPRLPRRAGAVGGRLLARGLPLARAERRGEQRAGVRTALEGRRAAARVRREPRAGAARAVPPRPSRRWDVARGSEHGRVDLRRLRASAAAAPSRQTTCRGTTSRTPPS